MHELAITQYILNIALEQAKAAEAREITRVNLVIGEMSGIVDDCVQFYFDFLSKDTIASNSALSFKKIPSQARCRTCKTVFHPEKFDWACPNCHGLSIEIVAGRESYVESIEVN